jgi:hypothetical protein
MPRIQVFDRQVTHHIKRVIWIVLSKGPFKAKVPDDWANWHYRKPEWLKKVDEQIAFMERVRPAVRLADGQR